MSIVDEIFQVGKD